MKVIKGVVGGDVKFNVNGVNGVDFEWEVQQIVDFLGEIIGRRVFVLVDYMFNKVILEVWYLEQEGLFGWF